jgi:LemA protein
MSFLKKPVVWVLGVLLLLALLSVSYYNRFTALSRTADTQWGQVENQFQRRFDLIPNLEASVKGIFKQEQEVFGALADARTRYSGATTVDEKARAAGEVETALSRLLVVVENYPQLRSSENVTRLMDELAGTENRIAVERGRFNQTVGEYNIAVSRIPGVIFAKLFGFDARALFAAAAGAETAPKIEF